MYMTINNDQVNLTILPFTDSSGKIKIGRRNSILVNEWTKVSLSIHVYATYNRREFILLTNTFMNGFSTPRYFALKLPGKLRFGDGQSPLLPSEPFLGFITAASLYNTVDTAYNIDPMHEPDVLQHAQESTWPSTPSIPWCPYRVQYDVDTNHVWPLDDKGLTRDIRTNTVNGNSQCLRFEQIHPTLPNHAVHVDGSPFASIMLPINGTEVDESFTLTVNVFILNESSGSLIKIVTILGQTLFEIVVTETELQFNAFTKTTTNCASLTLTENFTSNAWYVIGIKRDVESNSIGIIVDGSFSSTNDTCGIFGIDGDLSVQIGASSRYLPGYRGDVRCLILFNNPGSDIIDAIQDACTDANAILPTVPLTSCIPNLNSGYHVLFKRNIVLSDSLSPLATYITKSLIQCAISCKGHVFCRSFTYVDNQCLVYDLVTESGLISTPGAVYYILENRS
ncbi:hypothetical protein LOTGIDRAFT_159639 [Lottia gigantea]|uniref:Apple domain-containing protein n=1 Tax=Lottia gigantea TaxID=225164 RepID=V4AQ34_LOTGI|nr:hypothetical protein LOTGIDRAFT_159639 [Lottia gigantea]ESO96890.1 hypothetical protein LOTGIDRAFT_159639 [Lottia gigantea]